MSKKLATELEAREVAEAAREEQCERRSFSKRLFAGRLALDLLHPHPASDPEEQARAQPFLDRLHAFAAEHIDGDATPEERAELGKLLQHSRAAARHFADACRIDAFLDEHFGDQLRHSSAVGLAHWEAAPPSSGPRAKPSEPARLKPPMALPRVASSLSCDVSRIAGGNMMAAKTPRATHRQVSQPTR